MFLKGLNKSGMTLIELLMVIVIIIVMAELSIINLKKGVEIANRSFCVNNIHQLSMALSMFADEHNGAYPSEEIWCENSGLMPKYIALSEKDIFHCPSDYTKVKEEISNISYSINENAKKIDLKNPSNTILLVEYEPHESGAHIMHVVNIKDPTDIDRLSISGRHDGGSNVLFVDGSIMWHKQEEIITTASWWGEDNSGSAMVCTPPPAQ